MIKNYIRIAFRNILKYRGYSVINIFGLAIGIACCLLIMLFVKDELSYDRHYENSERIYRLTVKGVLGDNEFFGAVSCPPLAKTLVHEMPEVEDAVRIRSFGFPVLRYQDKVFSEERFYSADPSFFRIFDCEFIAGDPEQALQEPLSVVITESMAKKYFGNENPMGKLLNQDKRRDYIVTGVIKDPPTATHFHFDFIGTMKSYPQAEQDHDWLSNNYYTYILLKEGTDYKQVEGKLEELIRKYVAPYVQKAFGTSFDKLLQGGNSYNYYLQPLTSIHLYSDLQNEFEPNGTAAYVYIFSFIAIMILGIACINFMNLATARSANRSREIGIRKTLGSTRAQLIRQFLIETILMSLIALFIAVILVELSLTPFNRLVGKSIQAAYIDNILFIPILIIVAVTVGILAGIYPAFYLSAFDPIKIFRKTSSVKSSGSLLRNGLVILQFSISIILFIGTMVVYSQLNYIREKKLGFDKEQVLVIQKTDDIGSQIGSFKEQLKSLPGVVSVSNSNTLMGEQFGSEGWQLPGQQANEPDLLWDLDSDYEFARTYGIQMSRGRFYSEDWHTDHSAIVLNETAVRAIGIKDDPIGKELVRLDDDSRKFNIIGVMKDFHFESLQQSIKPAAILLFGPKEFGKYVSVRLTPGNLDEKIDAVKNIWRRFAGNQAFEYFFFDEQFSKTYKTEERTGTIATIFSLLAIFVACLGLLGLSSFATEQRTKEIGIRKVLGATSGGIVVLLSREFIKWVLFANLAAWPAAYFIMRKWLQDYAYRIDLNFAPFLISAVLALIIAAVTIGYQALKAAAANPVSSLKYE